MLVSTYHNISGAVTPMKFVGYTKRKIMNCMYCGGGCLLCFLMLIASALLCTLS